MGRPTCMNGEDQNRCTYKMQTFADVDYCGLIQMGKTWINS